MTAPQKGRIFISYRRADSAGYAGRIYDRLSAHFGQDAVFMDVDTIEAGLDFVEVLENAVQSCDVLIALIGTRWLNIKDLEGKRRLDNPEDFVRIEIAAALRRKIRVIPVLFDGVSMPNSTELPYGLKKLARRNAVFVNHHSFNANARRLISQLKLALEVAGETTKEKTLTLATPPTGRIFISYRRIDTRHAADSIFDRLSAHFGKDAVFMDVDSEAGLDFVKVLENAVQSCEVLVALIGKQWLNIKDAEGNRRLDNPQDFVRIEVATALRRRIRVIPVLVDGADLPSSPELPNNLISLTRRNALCVNHHSFNADTHRLISQLKSALNAAEKSKILNTQTINRQVQRQAEIERLLEQAYTAINLEDWELAQKKLSNILKLDEKHAQAQIKLNVTQRKIDEAKKHKAAKEKAKQEATEKAAKKERETAEKATQEKAKYEATKTTIHPKWITILWIALGYSIGALIGIMIGGIFYVRLFFIFPFALSGLAVTLILKKEKVLSNKKYMLWIIFSWAIGGAIVQSIGDEILNIIFQTVDTALSVILGLTTINLIGGFAIALTLRKEQMLSNKKYILWIIFGWAVGGVIGGAIMGDESPSSAWAPLTGIILNGLFGGFATVFALKESQKQKE